jgi:hypothetical protein
MDEKTWRKQRPVFSGVLAYFPDALLEVAYCSFKGNEQHNPGQPLHWAKEKSQDEPDALLRHMLDRAKGETFDSDGVRHLAKAAWRALANLQREIEAEQAASANQYVPQPDEPFRCPQDGEPDCCHWAPSNRVLCAVRASERAGYEDRV